jgi:hypothetical protein
MMNALPLGRSVGGMLVSIGLLAGCGGGSLTAGLPLGLPNSGTRAVFSGSNGDLIYAVGGCDGTCVLSYPSGKLVGALNVSGGAICSDSAGNVFIVDSYVVTEYAHGATKPKATLSIPMMLARFSGELQIRHQAA